MKQIQCAYDPWTVKFFHFVQEDGYYHHSKDWNICIYFLKYKHPNYIYIEYQKTWKEYFVELFEQFLDVMLFLLEIALKIVTIIVAIIWSIAIIGKLFL